jgi:nitrite reductase/ring-hydroxylating ferredoxin subunit
MTAKVLERMALLLSDGPDPRRPWLEEPAERLQGSVMALFERAGESGIRLKDALHGTWFGHALHPALILAPAGSWLTAAVLDLVGDDDGARTAVGFGILTSLPAAASGLADWGYTEGRSRRLGLAHAALNSAALSCCTLSWLARKSGHRGLGILLSTKGLALMTVSAYLGGEISYALGYGVNRNAWSPDVADLGDELDDFRPVARLDEVREGRLSAAELDLGESKISLVLMRRGNEVLALNGTCSHLGAPLAEGQLVDEWCVECPWHGSRFDFRDGEVVRGPAAYPQTKFETRVREGKVEARLARPSGDVLEQILTST